MPLSPLIRILAQVLIEGSRGLTSRLKRKEKNFDEQHANSTGRALKTSLKFLQKVVFDSLLDPDLGASILPDES